MTIEESLAELGFDLVQRRRNGNLQYGRRANPYLSWWVLVHPGDGTAELSWEVEIGAYLKAKGFHVSVQDELSLLLFPSTEVRGPATAEWLQTTIQDAERHIGSVDLLGGV